LCYSLARLFRCAAISFFMSSGERFAYCRDNKQLVYRHFSKMEQWNNGKMEHCPIVNIHHIIATFHLPLFRYSIIPFNRFGIPSFHRSIIRVSLIFPGASQSMLLTC